MVGHLLFYNTQRPHKTLGLISPFEYLISKSQRSHVEKNCNLYSCLTRAQERLNFF